MASYLDEFLNKPRNPQASGDIFSGLYNPEQIADLESQYTNEYGIQNTSGGIASDARHMSAMNNLSNSLSPMNNGIGNFIGDTGAFLAGGLNEIGALRRGFNRENLGEIGEDIIANFKGSYGTPNSTTAEDIYSQVFKGAVPQRVASGNPMGYGAANAADVNPFVQKQLDTANYINNYPAPKFGYNPRTGEELVYGKDGNKGYIDNVRFDDSYYGAAQASELTDLEKDFPGMSTGDIIDSMNNRAFIGRQISPMAKPQIASPRTVIDPNRIPGRIQESVEPRQGILQGLQDKIGAGFNNVKDFAMDKGNMGKNLLGSAGAMALGLPGIVGSGAMALMGGLGNAFEDRQLSGDGTTVDEYGRSYNASDLNKMNARGGYYTEAARSSRRRTNRINDMLARKAKGKRISAANLARLQAQEQAQEQARLTATRQMAQQNRQSGSGGYQSSFGGDSGFMGGSGTAAEMGSFRDGGLASMFTRRR